METKWLEDFISLAETRSFSRSAQLRHITQPAFSRRIQALEAWAGTDLVDRSAYPTSLTPAGQVLRAQAVDLLGALQATRMQLRSHVSAGQDVVEFAVPHSLAVTFFPQWVMDMRTRFGALKSRLVAGNVHDAVLHLTEGACDLLIAYHHPSQPLQLNPERHEMLVLGQETLAPYARADAHGHPMFRLPAAPGASVPFLGYASEAYLGRLVESIVKAAPEPLRLDPIYETDLAEGLRAMAIAGHGLAFLPGSSVGSPQVARDVHDDTLVRASDPGVCELVMDIRIYRERPELARRAKPGALALWEFLSQSLSPSE